MLTIVINEAANYAHAIQGSYRQTLTVAQANKAVLNYAKDNLITGITTNDSRERIVATSVVVVVGGAK